jgi:hypothetical protein
MNFMECRFGGSKIFHSINPHFPSRESSALLAEFAAVQKQFQNELEETKRIAARAEAKADQANREAGHFQNELEETKRIAARAEAKADQANREADQANREAGQAKLEAGQAKLETKASRADSRLLNLGVARNLITLILYDHCGFKTSHAGSPETFRLTFEGKASWQGKTVPGARERITELAIFYKRTVGSTNDLKSVVCRWDQIKDARNHDQHGLDISAKLSEMIDFYDRHLALGDELEPEHVEFNQFFRAVQEFKNPGRTFPVTIAYSTPTTVRHMPKGDGSVRPSCSYAQALAKEP